MEKEFNFAKAILLHALLLIQKRKLIFVGYAIDIRKPRFMDIKEIRISKFCSVF